MTQLEFLFTVVECQVTVIETIRATADNSKFSNEFPVYLLLIMRNVCWLIIIFSIRLKSIN